MPISIQELAFFHGLRGPEAVGRALPRSPRGAGLFELYYFTGGGGSFRSGAALHAVRPGSLVICPSGSPRALEVGEDDAPISFYAVLFAPEGGEEGLRPLLTSFCRLPPGNVGRCYRFFFEELKERGHSSSPLRRRAAVHQLASFLYLVCDREVPTGAAGSVHLERALDFMQDRVYGKVRLPEVAGRLGITESHMIRLFRQKMNITPMKYYTRLKVEAASALLADTPMAVREIADRLNFYSEYHFSRVFKNYTGSAPTIYRREQHRRRCGTGR